MHYKSCNLATIFPYLTNHSYQARNEPREVDLIEAGELTDDAAADGRGNGEADEDDEDVLMFLPSNAFEKAR